MGHCISKMQTMVPLFGTSAYHAGKCHSKAVQEHGEWFACRHQNLWLVKPGIYQDYQEKNLVIILRADCEFHRNLGRLWLQDVMSPAGAGWSLRALRDLLAAF